MKEKINVGDQVIWESSYLVKSGKVLAIILAGEELFPKIPPCKKSHIKNDVNVSSIDRALVEVMSGAHGDIPIYYGAQLSLLCKVNHHVL